CADVWRVLPVRSAGGAGVAAGAGGAGGGRGVRRADGGVRDGASRSQWADDVVAGRGGGHSGGESRGVGASDVACRPGAA
ncbi:hypothetical protein ACSTHS_00130, partial [Vibrio parahaemolyticus]